MMDRGIPVLPIHDSFIVAEGYADDLSATMLDAYRILRLVTVLCSTPV
jgi:hypothetical protein